ncbi:MAG TPA: SDR family oxidoreductase [Sphingorhabdus sp.]|jgi:NAD(P)-dependent dehydrogenase (short-subunit alcohol dehydrogenase family)|uniref:SDR family oxidoreductase n=1 Tax=Sphingorhabdus sp. TaxID=1902408 RepID=UPI002BD12F0D|nr:SDR family oxidoreductase [Sphingorhabdus sp.]HMT42396.1 SDR family oxidoreductase [Sphingorhabdus sp.]HMU20723.1 SDR family oxidoreductase [Sphingorhabdus sp.]
MATLKELHDLSGRVAIITGGSGHLGRAMASALIELECTVLLVDRNQERLNECAIQLRMAPSNCFAVDLEQDSERTRLASAIASRFKHIDILINNAAFVGDSGLSGWAATFLGQSVETWRRALEVNLTAPFHLIQLLHPLLVQSGNASIINIGSIYGMLGPDWSLYEGTPMANPAAYAASKGGLIQLTRWLSTSLAPAIRVNSISPGGIGRAQPDAFVEKYVARTPLKRMGREEDFLGIVAYLASDASAWVTGQNFAIDGGWSAW